MLGEPYPAGVEPKTHPPLKGASPSLRTTRYGICTGATAWCRSTRAAALPTQLPAAAQPPSGRSDPFGGQVAARAAPPRSLAYGCVPGVPRHGLPALSDVQLSNICAPGGGSQPFFVPIAARHAPSRRPTTAVRPNARSLGRYTVRKKGRRGCDRPTATVSDGIHTATTPRVSVPIAGVEPAGASHPAAYAAIGVLRGDAPGV